MIDQHDVSRYLHYNATASHPTSFTPTCMADSQLALRAISQAITHSNTVIIYYNINRAAWIGGAADSQQFLFYCFHRIQPDAYCLLCSLSSWQPFSNNINSCSNNNNGYYNNTRLTAIFQDNRVYLDQNVTILDFIGVNDDGGGGGDKWSYDILLPPLPRLRRLWWQIEICKWWVQKGGIILHKKWSRKEEENEKRQRK